MFQKNSTVLVLAPHTDDGELGCGGTIARLIREGHEVYYVAFCSCDESLPEGVQPGTLRAEVMRATQVLGISQERVRVLDFPVRFLADHRQAVLQAMVELNRELDPEAVFCPTREDLHQDHGVVAAEAMRAFKARTILGYEMPWNNISFDANLIVKLDEIDVDRKVAALAEYESQRHRPYITERFIRGLSHSRGVTIGHEYAEAFTLYRGVI
ncbi:PIG-L family deacetylase [Brevibacterium sp.]|uniref:PIG-L deacetylase family protein n=1 Tax=Brevibacterium sp. TaxID=1701 RepID=UPI00281128B6|nr:PIG-L family deacetylase [Brevibacterium sp.]